MNPCVLKKDNHLPIFCLLDPMFEHFKFTEMTISFSQVGIILFVEQEYLTKFDARNFLLENFIFDEIFSKEKNVEEAFEDFVLEKKFRHPHSTSLVPFSSGN